MCKSLLEELRFEIGEQYELNEFNLKAIESTFVNGLEYENYEYIKSGFKELFGLRLVGNIILQYNADILYGIIYKFDVKSLDLLIKGLNKHLPSAKQINEEKDFLGKTFTVISFQEFSLKLDIDRDITLKAFKSLG